MNLMYIFHVLFKNIRNGQQLCFEFQFESRWKFLYRHSFFLETIAKCMHTCKTSYRHELNCQFEHQYECIMLVCCQQMNGHLYQCYKLYLYMSALWCFVCWFLAGRGGQAIALVTQFDVKLVHAIEEHISEYF